MIGSTRSVRVWAYARPADMRKGFDGLSGLVERELGRSPVSGDLFLFVSRTRRRAKVLLWDGTGLCLYAKRLEKGRFARLWGDEERPEVALTMAELQLYLEGSTLVGKLRVSPQQLCLKCLTQHVGSGIITHAEARGDSRPGDPQADGNSPRKDRP